MVRLIAARAPDGSSIDATVTIANDDMIIMMYSVNV